MLGPQARHFGEHGRAPLVSAVGGREDECIQFLGVHAMGCQSQTCIDEVEQSRGRAGGPGHADGQVWMIPTDVLGVASQLRWAGMKVSGIDGDQDQLTPRRLDARSFATAFLRHEADR